MSLNLRKFAWSRAPALLPVVMASAGWSQLPAPAPRLTQSLAQPARQAPASQFPAAVPTQMRQVFAQPVSAPQPTGVAKPVSYRARVELVNNQLSVTAENSSLDQILRDIAQLTGMKITGGVNDERVYGNYGPDTAQVVLSELLDGTGTNVVLLETRQHTLAELLLSPRNGGPTPPSPNAMRNEEGNEENLPPGLGGRRREFPLARQPSRAAGDQNMGGESNAPAAPSNDETVAPPDAAQASPNGVKTPQQMYQEFSRQRQQPPTTPPQ
jgi:hypothetical protein